MPFNADLGVFTAATVVLWAVSGALSVVLGLVFAAGSLGSVRPWRLAAIISVNVTRGVPAGLLVIAAGIGMMRVPGTPQFPTVFPGTLDVFQHVGWAIVLALALSSSGHLAMTFRAAALALGRYRREQAAVLGLSLLNRTALLARECAATVLPPTGARLVHHLHNTTFASLFPVMELFGYIQGEANATFRVLEFTLLGCAIYVLLSGLTWILVRMLESALAPPLAEPGQRMGVKWL